MKFIKTALCLSLSMAITACSEQVSVESRLTTAKSYLSENKINESIIALKNAIRADAKNAEARFLLGQIYLNLGDGASATKELERANQFGYDANKVLPLLARAYILTKSDADVLALSEMAQMLSPAEYSHYLAYKTLAELRSEKRLSAKDSVVLAKSIDGENKYSLLALAYLRLAEQRYDEVRLLLLQILILDDKQVDALLLQGQLSMITKEYAQAAQSFKVFLELQPRVGVVKLLLAEALLKSERFDEAEKYADDILAKVKSQPFAHYIKAMVAFYNENYEQSSEHAEFSISGGFNQYNLRLVAGASAFYLKNWELSYKHLSSVVKYLPKEHLGRRMLAVTQLELGLINEISSTVSDFRNVSGDAQFVSSLSYKLLELGAIDEAKKLLEQNDVTSPNEGDSARRGVLKLMMNDPSGLVDLEKAVSLNPDFIEAELALAYGAIQNNDIEKARDIAKKWQKKYPEKPGSYSLMASIAMKEQRYDQAEELLKRSLTLEPDNLHALLEQLRSAREQQNITLSQQRVDYLISLKPNNNKVLMQYFVVYQNKMGLKKLQTAYNANKADIEKGLILAEAMISLKQYKPAERLLTSIVDSPKLPKRYWRLMIVSVKQQNEHSRIQPILERWVKASPYHIEPILFLVDLHSSNGDNNRALTVINSGLEHHKDNVVLQLVKMQILLNSQRVKPAIKLFEKLAQSNINEALKEGFLGRIMVLEERYAQAIPKLKVFYKTYPTSKNAIYLAHAYIGSEEEPKAIRVFEQHVKIDGHAYNIKTMLAGFYLKEDPNRAILIYEDIVKKQPSNVVAHNNLAWLYLQHNQLDTALIYAEKAFTLAPEVADIADTYATMLFKSGDKNAALEYASQASELAQGENVNIQLHYIEILIANSRDGEAKGLLNKVTPITDEQAKIKDKLQAQL